LKEELSDIYVFNPTCEYAIANGHDSWHPNKLLQKMELDLETLPMFFSTPKDYVLVDKLPSSKFKKSLRQLNIKTPNFILTENISGNKEFLNLQKNKLLPWGWSPAMHKQLSVLKPGCSDEFKKSPVYFWQPESKNLYSKKFARGILKTLISEYPDDSFIQQDKIAEICTTQKEFEVCIKRWGRIMVKAPWSSSGRGLQPIVKSFIHQKVWAKLLGIVNEQGYAIVEPYLDKVFDLAYIFELKKGKVIFCGTSNFTTNKKGQYIGNSLNGLPDETDKNILDFVKTIPQKIIQPLIKIIEGSDLSKYYEGFFGVDTLIYNDKSGTIKVNPCLEINVRQNMGLLSLRLEKLIHADKKGIYRIYYKPGTTFLQFKKKMEKKHPLKISNHKIESGFFSLTEALNNTLFGAYILV
jgi:hypothetical protein